MKEAPKLDLSEATINMPENNDACRYVLNNYTSLHQEDTQKKLGAILNQMDCSSGTSININARITDNIYAKPIIEDRENIELGSSYFIWKMSINGCLAKEPGKDFSSISKKCIYPRDGDYLSSQIDDKKIFNLFEDCKNAMNEQALKN